MQNRVHWPDNLVTAGHTIIALVYLAGRKFAAVSICFTCQGFTDFIEIMESPENG